MDQEITFIFQRKQMKKFLLILVVSSIYLSAVGQKITLAIHQDYLKPDIPLITQNGDLLRSSSPIGNQWYKDGVELLGEKNQTLILVSSGNYKVGVTLGSGCSSESLTYNAIKTDVSVIQTAELTCKVFPNPNNGMFTIEMESDQLREFELELFTSNGESVIKQSISQQTGIQQIPFGKSLLANGVYYLQIKYGTNFISRQIIVN